jgi:hypothetical protein
MSAGLRPASAIASRAVSALNWISEASRMGAVRLQSVVNVNWLLTNATILGVLSLEPGSKERARNQRKEGEETMCHISRFRLFLLAALAATSLIAERASNAIAG